MSEVQHAPGPWQMVQRPYCVRVESDGKQIIAFELDDFDESHNARCLANAHLIAAAPDLLAACRALVDADKDASIEPLRVEAIGEAIDLAEAAIAKAEGRS